MELDDAPPEVVIPPGIGSVRIRPEDAAAVYRVIEDAFNEWPDRQPTDFAGWSAHVSTIRHSHRSSPGWRSTATSGRGGDGRRLPGPGVRLVEQLATRGPIDVEGSPGPCCNPSSPPSTPRGDGRRAIDRLADGRADALRAHRDAHPPFVHRAGKELGESDA